MLFLLAIPRTRWGVWQRQREILRPESLKPKQKITESHKNKTQANHRGSKHIAHTFARMDYKTTPESWPGLAPNRSALACVQNKLGLSVGNSGGLRPRCLAGAEGAAGCQWSVPGGASGNRVTDAPPHGVVEEVKEEQHSYDQAAGSTVMDELILAGVQTRGEPDPWSLSCLHEVTLQEHRASAGQPLKTCSQTQRITEVHSRPER